MRVLFSGVPAFGHLLPLVPFVRAAQAQGHDVAVLTSAAMEPALAVELPGVPFLGAGPEPMEIVAEVARHSPGADPINNPQPETVADFFAGARIDLAYDDALAAARTWRPDVLVVDAADFVGPIVAAGLAVPYAMVAFGPEVPPEFTQPMIKVAASRYAERGLTMQPPIAVVDPAPASFQAPGWAASPVAVSYRAEPYSRGTSTPAEPSVSGERPTVLVTLGTVFNDASLLTAILTSVAALDVEVVATLGVQLSEPPITAANIRYEGFRPLAELLPSVDVVVTTGGAGTVLAAANAAVPLVVLPQGADQFINAARAEAAGVAVVTADPTSVGDAVTRILSSDEIRGAARSVAAEIAARPDATTVLTQVLSRV
jgi:UDP:flavonoid glycosyltransferase YjiC (YdhE family)